MKVKIREGWENAGKHGVMLGDQNFLGYKKMEWTPVLWDNEEDPDFHKTIGLDFGENFQFDGSIVKISIVDKNINLHSKEVLEGINGTKFPVRLKNLKNSLINGEAKAYIDEMNHDCMVLNIRIKIDNNNDNISDKIK